MIPGFALALGLPRDALTPMFERSMSQLKLNFYPAQDKPEKHNPDKAGDRTGGAARPLTDFCGLSRSRGPLGGVAQPRVPDGPQTAVSSQFAGSAEAPRIDPGQFFNVDAKILGTILFIRRRETGRQRSGDDP